MRRSFSHSEIHIGSPSMTDQPQKQDLDKELDSELVDGNNFGILKKLPMINDDELDDDNHKMVILASEFEETLMNYMQNKRFCETRTTDEFFKLMKSLNYIEKNIGSFKRFVKAKGINRF
jgi:hypothetical protein